MADIAARLRDHISPHLKGETPCVRCQAADEIVKLRAEYRQLRGLFEQRSAVLTERVTENDELTTRVDKLLELGDAMALAMNNAACRCEPGRVCTCGYDAAKRAWEEGVDA